MPAYHPAEIHALFERAFNCADIEAVVALYEPMAVLLVGGTEVVGRDGIRKVYESFFAGRGRMTLETRAVIASGEGLAVLHGSWVHEPVGSASIRGLSTEVVRRQPDGSWLFVIDVPNTPCEAVSFTYDRSTSKSGRSPG